MISKSNRLSYQNILSVKKSGVTTRVSSVLVRYIFNKEDMIPKIAVVISKKTAKTAVLRHRIKRIMIDILFPFVKNKQGFYGIISLSQLSKEYKKLTTIPEKQLFREELKIIGEKLSKL